jgi:hypothetical protein
VHCIDTEFLEVTDCRYSLACVLLYVMGSSWMYAGGKVKRLAVDATLRTAAPYQKSRKARAEAAGKTRKVYVEKVHTLLHGTIDANTIVDVEHHITWADRHKGTLSGAPAQCQKHVQSS